MSIEVMRQQRQDFIDSSRGANNNCPTVQAFIRMDARLREFNASIEKEEELEALRAQQQSAKVNQATVE